MTTQHSSGRGAEVESSDRSSRQALAGLSSGCEAEVESSDRSSRQALAGLSDGELLERLSRIVKQERGVEVAVLLHLAEVERRGLHLARGCSSLFAYCVQRLGFSEDVAYKRVGAARYGRRFPLALDLLGQGALNLSALMLVGPHLTDANHHDWLTAVLGKTKREIELLIATRCPKPDVPPSVRKLPNRQAATRRATEPEVGSNTAHETVPAGLKQQDGTTSQQVTETPSQQVKETASQPVAAPRTPAARPQVQAWSATTFRVVFTASEGMKQKLDRAQELCSHRVAPSDLPALLELALDSLIEREENRRYAVQPAKTIATKRTHCHRTSPPRTQQNGQAPDPLETADAAVRPSGSKDAELHDNQPPQSSGKQDPDPVEAGSQSSAGNEGEGEASHHSSKPDAALRKSLPNAEFSRYVPVAVRRAVWQRDGGQCAFVDDQGNRCTERRFLEVDHIVAHARGGAATTGNCRLLCRSHNQHWARVTFGDDFVERARSRQNTVQSATRSNLAP